MFPSLLINSIWFSTTEMELRLNLRSLMWGIGVKGYPEPWWRGQLLRFFKDNQLDRVVAFKDLFAWVREEKDHQMAQPFRGKNTNAQNPAPPPPTQQTPPPPLRACTTKSILRTVW